MEVPQWKRELILRLRSKRADEAPPQSPSAIGHQPAPAISLAADAAKQPCPVHEPSDEHIMVKERILYANGSDDSSSSEDLHYGPGIVSKLKNRYLTLTLRENNANRPSILPMRKATSLEHLLEQDAPKPQQRLYQKKARQQPHYHLNGNAAMKRTRSVEAISSRGCDDEKAENRKSLPEEVLIKEGNNMGKPEYKYNRINRPKRIVPIMSEKEKPPVDVVKQTKRIFERAEHHRKQQTGEVAAKVATYKSIIGQQKPKKPPLPKCKPTVTSVKQEKPAKKIQLRENGWISENKYPDISIVSPKCDEKSLCETPDLILHSSPVKHCKIDSFLQAEIKHTDATDFRITLKPVKDIFEANQLNIEQASPEVQNNKTVPPFFINKVAQKPQNAKPKCDRANLAPPVTSQAQDLQFNDGSSLGRVSPTHKSHSPTPQVISSNQIGKAPSPNVSPVEERIKDESRTKDVTRTPANLSSRPPPQKKEIELTAREIEKNTINAVKSYEHVKSEAVRKAQVPKTPLLRSNEQNSVVFKFTDRKDVPDYVCNDGRVRTGKIEKPKVGEGGIIFLPGATLDESFLEDDEDWQLSLEGPPSPCDVNFINDNVLIDGRSSLSQNSKKLKMKISFVDSGPDIFEYPSESSFLDEPVNSRESSPGHVVPSLSGSSLANYIPKSGSTEDFQLGITYRSIPLAAPDVKMEDSHLDREVEEPVLFSTGTNSDILF